MKGQESENFVSTGSPQLECMVFARLTYFSFSGYLGEYLSVSAYPLCCYTFHVVCPTNSQRVQILSQAIEALIAFSTSWCSSVSKNFPEAHLPFSRHSLKSEKVNDHTSFILRMCKILEVYMDIEVFLGILWWSPQMSNSRRNTGGRVEFVHMCKLSEAIP